MKTKHRLLLISLLFSFPCCKNVEDKKQLLPLRYYDLKGFMELQAQKYNSQHLTIDKFIEKDGKKESKTIKNVDWKKELEIFEETDINRPGWRNSYSGDTLKVGDYLLIHYKAKEQQLPVREIMLTISSDGSCRDVSIEKETKNFFHTSFQQLYFNPDSGYRIKGRQQVRFIFETTYSVRCKM